jgi:hypothetical protein
MAQTIKTTCAPWEHRLFADLHQLTPNFNDYLAQDTIVIASDGSLDSDRGTFAWAVGNGSSIFWTCAGPVDGSTDCLSSQRAELFGILSVLRFLHHFTAISSCPASSSAIKLYCDNKSAVKHACPPDQPIGPIRACHADADLAFQIHDTLRNLPHRITIEWVKGHQDRGNTPIADLPRPAQMNIIADTLASEYWRTGHLITSPQVLIYPASQIGLTINHRLISNHHKCHIRHASLLPALRQYLMRRNAWTPQVYSSIAWSAHDLALQRLSPSQRQTIAKFQHRWLPVGHNQSKHNVILPKRCMLCSTCPDETEDHICLCPHPSLNEVRVTALSQLDSTMKDYGTDQILRSVITQGIWGWLNNGLPIKPIVAPPNHPAHNIISLAIAQQNSIGWHQFLRGRLTTVWGQCYDHWTTTSDHQPNASHRRPTATQWLSRIVTWSLQTFLNLWRTRNQLTHDSAQPSTNSTRAALAAKIQDYYLRSHELPRSDQDTYFTQPLPEFLSQSPHTLSTWIAHVDRIFIRHRKEIRQRHKRSLITYHFQRTTPLV